MERANNDVISEALVAGFEILDRGKTGTIDIALYKQLIQELSHYSRQLSLVVDDHSDQILELVRSFFVFFFFFFFSLPNPHTQ